VTGIVPHGKNAAIPLPFLREAHTICCMEKWRTPEAEAYRRLYQTKRWKRLREMKTQRSDT
jgi:hypothetical protein